MHDLPLISTIAAAFTAAWLFGLLTQWLRLSPIVGYLVAGILIGPYTPGFVGDVHLAQQLAEVGVILLMFGVGLHFHVKDLLAVKGVAIPGAVGQSLVATLLAIVVFSSFGMPLKAGMVLGMALAVASTVVLMRVLLDADVLNSTQGHVAVGWLIVEDIFTVILLVLIPVMGNGAAEAAHAASSANGFWTGLGLALLKLAALVVIVLVVGSRVVPWVLVRVARLRSRELFTLTVLVFSIAMAAGSYFFFGASMALGAFLAGMVVAQSPVSHQAAADALPMRDAFAVLFFVSVGMLFDPAFLIQEPVMVLAALAIILIAKPLAALVIVALLGYSGRTGLTVALGLAQIGEFSFILSDLAGDFGLMPPEGHNVLVASAIISITLNPLLFNALPRIESALRRRPSLWAFLNGRAERRALATNRATVDEIQAAPRSNAGLAIVIGYGPVGRSVNQLLKDAHLETLVVDMNLETVGALKEQGERAIFGDAASESILEQAGIKRAQYLILTLPHSTDRAAIVTAARAMNPTLRIFVRARYLRERDYLVQVGANAAVFEEVEAAIALSRLVLTSTGVHRQEADTRIRNLRLQLIMENVSNLRSQRVRSVMVPWSRVRGIPHQATNQEVLQLVSQERFSRWPVFPIPGSPPSGYLLTKDLLAHVSDSAWTSLIRPLHQIPSIATIADALGSMQSESATIYLVIDGDQPVGLITLEDILEQVVGQIEDEYPHAPGLSLAGSIPPGGILLDPLVSSRGELIEALIDTLPTGKLPEGSDQARLVEQTRMELEEAPADLGNGVAVPSLRVPGLAAPLVTFARLDAGLPFSPEAGELVRLVFLLVIPDEEPELQIALINHIAQRCEDPAFRDALLQAESPAAVITILQPPLRPQQAD